MNINNYIEIFNEIKTIKFKKLFILIKFINSTYFYNLSPFLSEKQFKKF